MRDYKVIDTFIFGGELEMLKMRLDYYYDSVDYFVFSESNITHSNKSRELVYEANIDMFKEYQDKIHYVLYTPTQEELVGFDQNAFLIEVLQRECLRKKVMELSDDNTLILLSDVDEFPKIEKFDIAREKTKDLFLNVVSFEQDFYYYSPLNLVYGNWHGTVAFNHATLISVVNYYLVRTQRDICEFIPDAGYHFSFFGTPEEIQEKIISFSHQEFNKPEYTDIETINHKIHNGLDIFDRGISILRLDDVKPDFPEKFNNHKIFYQNIKK